MYFNNYETNDGELENNIFSIAIKSFFGIDKNEKTNVFLI
jgi:hypothetical protein